MSTQRRCLVVGSSDGIGQSLVQSLARDGWFVAGLSRSASATLGDNHEHVILDVTSATFRDELAALCERLGPFETVIYCAGVGELLDLAEPVTLAPQRMAFEVNLLGAVDTFEVVARGWRSGRGGHFVVLSSLADRLVGPASPGYNASKAGVTVYFESMALAMKARGIAITVVRLGFVDTKMAKSPLRPFMITRERAAAVVKRALTTRPLQRSAPWPMVMLVFFLELALRLRVWWG